MKRTRLLHSRLSLAIAQLGHTDAITLADAGLPIPPGPERIDLAVEKGLPGFLPVLDVILSEMMVEEIILATEIHTASPPTYSALLDTLHRHGMHPKVTELPHTSFKTLTAASKAIIRTGECTPYANVILKSGVTF